MPHPKLSGKMKKSEIIKEYKKVGWDKLIEFDWVEISGRTGEIIKKRYVFNADLLQCNKRGCQPHQLTFVQLAPHGVIWGCAVCKRTEGPIAWEDGTLTNGPAGEIISKKEAWDIINKNKQTKPIGLDPVSGNEDLEIIPG